MTPKLYRAFITPGVGSRDRTVFRYHYKANIVTLPFDADFWVDPKKRTTTARTRRGAAARLRSLYNRELRGRSGFTLHYRRIP